MSEQVMRALREGIRNVKEYTPIIECKLRRAGVEINPAVVYFTAMNYPALKELANE